jgi:hypothetical protein
VAIFREYRRHRGPADEDIATLHFIVTLDEDLAQSVSISRATPISRFARHLPEARTVGLIIRDPRRCAYRFRSSN